jgi:hypothetical protein
MMCFFAYDKSVFIFVYKVDKTERFEFSRPQAAQIACHMECFELLPKLGVSSFVTTTAKVVFVGEEQSGISGHCSLELCNLLHKKASMYTYFSVF